MNFPHASKYAGEIDWNAIYRTFYPLPEMKRRIREMLIDAPGQPVLFAGFAELAADVAKDWPTRFVEHSEHMADVARVEFPEIQAVIYADILNYLALDDSPIVLIICRVSAYWQDVQSFDRLVTNLIKHPRKLIMLDFFDSAALAHSSEFEMLITEHGKGIWHFSNSRVVDDGFPTITLSTLNGRFDDGLSVVEFNAELAFFDQYEVSRWLKAALPDYDISIAPPLVPGDPGFLVVLQKI